MKKRILAWLLVCLMVVGSLPVTAFAQDEQSLFPCPGKGAQHTNLNCEEDLIDIVEATCQIWGYELYCCVTCGDYFASNLVAPGDDQNHYWAETTPAVEATCTEPGTTAIETCAECGKTRGGDKTNPLGHDYVTNSSETGSCLTGYQHKITCSRCDYVDDSGTMEAGHLWSQKPIDIIAPTCVDDGMATYVCMLCGTPKYVVIVAAESMVDHVWEAVEGKAATCVEDGVADHFKCKTCDALAVVNDGARATYIIVEKYEDLIIEKLGHDIVSKSKDPVAPTCTEKGLDIKVCSRCDDYYEEIWTDALGHDFKSKLCVIVNEIPGDCYTDKILTYQCTRCDETSDRNLGKQHNWTEFSILDPTCTEFGYKYSMCPTCGSANPENEIYDPTGHTYGDTPISTIDPTCLTEGEKVYECVNGCSTDTEGHYNKVVVDATGHQSKNTFFFAGTCDTAGIQGAKYTICQNPNCDGETITEYVAEDGTTYTFDAPVVLLTFEQTGYVDHAYDNGVINEATCEKDGNGAEYCIYCKVWGAFVIPATGHNWVSKQKAPTLPSCTEAGHDIYVCTNCGEVEDRGAPATGHTEGEPVTVKPTCSAVGYTAVYCTVCQEMIGDPYDVTPFNFDKTRPDYNGAEIIFYYDTLEAAQEEHTGIDPLSEVEFRKGTCLIFGLYKYTCSDCGRGILVVIDGTGKGHTLETITVSAADCLNNAVVYERCTVEGCGYTTDEHEVEDSALGHAPVVVDAVEAGCLTPGNEAYIYCSRCGAFLDEENNAIEVESDDWYVNDALGHDWEVHEASDPTCEESGNKAYTVCTRCGLYLGEDGETFADESENDYPWFYIAELGHLMALVDSAEATCTTPGYKHYDCIRCEHFYEDNDNMAYEECINEYEPALGHDYYEFPATEPTCTESGWVARKVCARCGDTDATDVGRIPATGHHNAAGLLLENRCDNEYDGVLIADRLCVDCGETIGHEHAKEFARHFDATCKEYAYDLFVCLWCGMNTVENVEEEAGYGDHSWTDWYVSQQPTYTENGVMARYCTVCGKPEFSEDVNEHPEIAVQGALKYSLKVENFLNSDLCMLDSEYNDKQMFGCQYQENKLPIVNGSYVMITISVEGDGVNIWGLNYSFLYEHVFMQLEAVYFANTEYDLFNSKNSFSKASLAFDENSKYYNGHINFVTTVTSNEEFTGVTIDGTYELAYLIFKVDCYNYSKYLNNVPVDPDSGDLIDYNQDGEINGQDGKYFDGEDGEKIITWTGIGVRSIQAVDSNGKLVKAEGEKSRVDIKPFLDVNSDGWIDILDAYTVWDILMGMMPNVEYLAAADANQDGVIDMFDFYAIFDFVTGLASYDDIVDGYYDYRDYI